jgi:hypothetical protein
MKELLMNTPIRFDELLDAVEQLPTDEQAQLMAIVGQRLAEKGRQRVVEEVNEASSDYTEGRCKVASVDDIVREIES